MRNETKSYMINAKSFLCHEIRDTEIPRCLIDAGWTLAVLGAIHHTAYRCPVNGDGYRYSVQDVCDPATGNVVAQVPYHGPGAAFGEI